VQLPQSAWEGFWAGWHAGDAECFYKLSLPFAWVFGSDEFDTLADWRREAWMDSGLHGTATQYWTQVSANGAVGSLYAAFALEGAAAAGISELGYATSMRGAYYTLWNEATVVGATGTIFPAAYIRNPQGMIEVSRWGREGLQPNDWVMKGRASGWNYFWSGKYQPGFGNQFAPYGSGTTYVVPEYTIRNPNGYFVIDGIIKTGVGQRIYDPSLVPGGLLINPSPWPESISIIIDQGGN